MALGYFLQFIIKPVVEKARPENALISEGTYSFPSAHTLMSTIFFSLLLYSFKDYIKNKTLRVIFMSLCIFLILAIAFSKIYLAAHWFSDVLAGFFLGTFIVSFMILMFKHKIKVKH